MVVLTLLASIFFVKYELFVVHKIQHKNIIKLNGLVLLTLYNYPALASYRIQFRFIVSRDTNNDL